MKCYKLNLFIKTNNSLQYNQILQLHSQVELTASKLCEDMCTSYETEQFNANICGFHVYKSIWQPIENEVI